MKEMRSLLQVMQRLRDPDGGCPWDLEQNFQTIAPYTIEEAYEVADAIEREDYTELKNELGDLLLQVIFHAQMADEAGLFNFAGVAAAISTKLIRRHPHVFGDELHETAGQVLETWENIKSEERQDKEQHGTLDDVPGNLPALLRAHKLQKRAARVGFDWHKLSDVFAKVREEMDELQQEIDAAGGDNQDRIAEEAGDLLFSCVNLTRHLKVNAEDCLRAGNRKFEQRFRKLEATVLERGQKLEDLSLVEMDTIWDSVK